MSRSDIETQGEDVSRASHGEHPSSPRGTGGAGSQPGGIRFRGPGLRTGAATQPAPRGLQHSGSWGGHWPR